MDREGRIRYEAAAPALRNFESRRRPKLSAKYIEASRQEGYSNSTINHRAQQLRQAFKVGIRNKQLSQQPFILRLSKVSNESQGFFETADFEAVRAKLPAYLRDFGRIGFLSGWGKGSIQSLRWSDVGVSICVRRIANHGSPRLRRSRGS